MKYFTYTEIHLNFGIPFILYMYVHIYTYLEFWGGGGALNTIPMGL